MSNNISILLENRVRDVIYHAILPKGYFWNSLIFFCNDQNKNFARNNQYIRQHLTPDGEYTLGSFPTINES